MKTNTSNNPIKKRKCEFCGEKATAVFFGKYACQKCYFSKKCPNKYKQEVKK